MAGNLLFLDNKWKIFLIFARLKINPVKADKG